MPSYRPLRLFIPEWSPFPTAALNFLCCAIQGSPLTDDAISGLFERVSRPTQADAALVPYDINCFVRNLDQVRKCRGVALERHIYVDSRDSPEPWCTSGIHLKVSVNRISRSELTICIPYVTTINHFRNHYLPATAPAYGLSFVGGSTPQRLALVQRAIEVSTFPHFFAFREGCFLDRHLRPDLPPYTQPEVLEREAARVRFVTAALNSRYGLALPGYGSNTSRFFELLALGVSPILISAGTALPFEDEIDYKDFTFFADLNASDPAFASVDFVKHHWEDASRRGDAALRAYEGNLIGRPLYRHLHRRLSRLLA